MSYNLGQTGTAMNAERLRQLEELYHLARENRAVLDQADPELRREVESLLAQDSLDGVMERPPLEVAAELLADSTVTQMPAGTQLGPYRIEGSVGAGGMGEVYKARDTRLHRTVAIKLVRQEYAQRTDFRERLRREARAISALNHPHICSLYDIGEQDGRDYLVMEYLDGETLAQVLKKGPLQIEMVLRYGEQIADGLAAAHARRIINRDLKPANIMITSAGVKILDFGLAKRSGRAVSDQPESTVTIDPETRAGEIIGTVAYMSPEQAEGKDVGAGSDIFSLGVVLYEMLCGRRPFQGDTTLSTLAAILRGVPEPPRRLRPETPEELQRIVLRCLEKKPEARYPSADELDRELKACQARLTPMSFTLRRPVIAAAVLALVVAVGAFGAWRYVRASRARWAESEALPEASRLLEKGRPFAALRLVRQAEQYASPSSPGLFQARARLRKERVSIRTSPPGADVYADDYDGDPPHWELLGRSPLETERLPIFGYYRVRAVKDGFEPVEWAVFSNPNSPIQLTLHARADVPSGMVWVPGGNDALPARAPVPLSEFWLDKYEVTNRQFKEFVDAGGYQKQEYWKQPFLKAGKVLSWEQAMMEFRDPTGRPGPATWEVGTYPEGKADFPVGGVSWYEAAAYAEFAGKSLPTVYHWYHAAGLGLVSRILSLSNFGRQGPAPAGAYRGLGPFGTYDMAGNLKEWCSSQAGERRYILGGAWNEPTYAYRDTDASRPIDRAANFGFRLAKYTSPLPDALTGPVLLVSRDRRGDKPANDQAFAIYRSLHLYDKTDLKSRVESVEDNSPYWRQENVTFQAAYGNERVVAHVYLPKNAMPPYQVVAYFPPNGVEARTAEEAGLSILGEFIIRSGRALILPAYKGMLERGPIPVQPGDLTNQAREIRLDWSKDLGRSIDYLETRPEMDTAKIAYYGYSTGAVLAPRLIAVEPRFKAAVLVAAGSASKVPGEGDTWNFASRVKIPVLMLNGRDDFLFPVETTQLPLFHLLGTPEKDKRHILYDGGHVDFVNRMDFIKEALGWLDRYLGPAKLKT